MKSRNSISFFACFMTAIMLISALSGLSAAFGIEAQSEGYKLIQMDDVTVASQKANTTYLEEQEEETVDPETIVSVIVKLEDKSVLETYGTLENADNGYRILTTKGEDIRANLLSKQRNVADKIESELNLNVDFEYQYTLAFNGFAFKAPYGAIESIKAIDGVETAEASTIYDVPEEIKGTQYGTKNYEAADMVRAMDAWNAGYDGEGMLIAVLDTGLDTDHEAFMQAPDTLKLTKEDVESVLSTGRLQASKCVADLTADQLYLRDKVPFAFDYANKDVDVNHGASDHGSHVAGISLADPQEPMLGLEDVYCRGIAPKAQLAVMKVFPDSGSGSAWTDIMAALEDCVYIGADVANLSLGSPLGYPNIDKTYESMYNSLDANGIIVACAAGNDYSAAYDSTWGTDMPTTENLDSSMVGSPSTYTESLSVAAIYNNKIFYADYVAFGEDKFGYSDTSKSTGNRPDLQLKVALAGKTLDMVAIPGLGEEQDYAGIDVAGKVALVSRGQTTFADKEATAANHGAAAILVYDNVESASLINMAINTPTIPAAFISRKAGLLALDRIKEGNAQVYISDGTGMISDATNGATPTDFSSWGPLANLTIKPEISAPGGNIMSTVDPAIGGEGRNYASYSGTSMATPNISGCIALVRQYVNSRFPDYSYQQKTEMVNTLLMSTANPVVNDKGVEYGVRRQGAGMASIIKAISTQAYLSTDSNVRPKLELGDDPQRTGVYTLNFKVTNFGDKTLTYKIVPSMTTANYEWIDQGDRATYVTKDDNMSLSDMMTYTTNYDNNTVVVSAGETKEITVTMTVNDEFRKLCEEVFKFGAYVEGYCYLKGEADSEGVIPTDLSICYLGYYGGWSEVPVIDGGYYYDKPEDDLSCMLYPNTAASKLRSSVYYEIGMNPYIDEESAETTEFAFLADRGSISPANEDKYYDSVDFFTTGIMRNLRKFYYKIYDAETGEIYWEKNAGSVRKNADTSFVGYITPYGVSSNKMKSWSGGETAEGTTVYIGCGGEAYYDGWDDSQATRAYWEIPVTLDNTAPTVVDSWSEGTTVYVKVTDNHYAAYAGVFDVNDTENAIAKTFIAENERGAETTVAIDMTGRDSVYLLLGDYACNEAQFVVTKSGAAFAPIPPAPETDDTYYAPVYELEDGETYIITTTGAYTGSEDTVYALTGAAAQPYGIRLQGAAVNVENQYITGGSKLATMEWKYSADGSMQNVESGKYLGLTQYGDAYWLGMNDKNDVKWTFDGRNFYHNSTLTQATHLIYFSTIENSDVAAFDVFDPTQSSSKIAVYKKVVKQKEAQATLTTTITEDNGKLNASINLTKNSGIASGLLTLTYDANVLEFVKAKAGSAADGVLIQANSTVPGKAIIAFASVATIADDGGELLNVEFNIKAQKGTLAVIDLTASGMLADDTVTEISTEAIGASYIIGGGEEPQPSAPVSEVPTTPPVTEEPTTPPVSNEPVSPSPSDIPGNAVKMTLSYVSEVDKVITIKLSISENSEVASGAYEVIYDSNAVEFLKNVPGELMDGYLVVTNTNNPGKVIVSFAGTENVSSDGGEVATFTFKVKDGVANGTELTFDLKINELINEDSVTEPPYVGIGCKCVVGGAEVPTTPPVSEAPTTPPVSEAPTTPPVSEAPTTPPVSEAPTTPPVSEAPTTPPVSNEPTAQPSENPTTAPTVVPTATPAPGGPDTGAQIAPYAAIILAVFGILGVGYFFLRRNEEM